MPHAIRGAVADGANPSLVDQKYSALMLAIWDGYFENAKALIELGADIHYVSTAEGSVGSTPLHIAAFVGAKEVVEMLLALDARKDVVDADGDTPYSAAIRGGHPELAELLKI